MNTRIQETWRTRVLAEYRSAAITSELLHWLFVLGVSPDTLETGRRIIGDELAHAELCLEVLLAAGGGAELIPLPRSMLWNDAPDVDLELRALDVCADRFCCGESVAVPLFLAMREGATQPQARAALDRICVDEAVHRAFGWSLLAELIQRLGEPAKDWLRPRAAEHAARAARFYEGDHDVEACEWGILGGERTAAISRRCVDEVVRPRFARLLG